MTERMRWLLWTALLAAGGMVAAMGDPDRDVSLDSVYEIWSDVLRDTDQITLKAARVPAAEEMRLGANLATGLRGAWPEDPVAGAYVNAVGAMLTPHLHRRTIVYQFHVVESPDVNAFALPGGHVYVTRGMMSFLKSEAELAAVLGHEMSHVDLKHCIGRYQYETAMNRVGAAQVGRLTDHARRLISMGYSQAQELDADSQGSRISIEAGYDPDAGTRVFSRLEREMGEPGRAVPSTPSGEVISSVGGLVQSYFRSHPPSEKRARLLRDLALAHRKSLAGRTFYVGAGNFVQKIPRSRMPLAGETVVYSGPSKF